jgi:hypothetical protein
VDYALAARVQALLEGVPLPAEKSQLLSYGRRQRLEPDELAALQSLPDREYERLDDVGEEIAGAQPSWQRREAEEPQEESDAVPGGIRDYVTPNPTDTGKVRDVGQVE